MKTQYKDIKVKICGYDAVSIDKNDSLLSGKHGFIFSTSNPQVLGLVQVRNGNNSEFVSYCNIKRIKWALSKIGYSMGRMDQQLHFANNPNERTSCRLHLQS